MLLDRLNTTVNASTSDPKLRKRIAKLYIKWARTYENRPEMAVITTLQKHLSAATKGQVGLIYTHNRHSSNSGPSMGSSSENEYNKPPPKPYRPPDSSSSLLTSDYRQKPKKPVSEGAHKPIDIDKERASIEKIIKDAHTLSKKLQGTIDHTPEYQVLESDEINLLVKYCSGIRRKLLRYIVGIQSEKWLNPLIQANEEIVNVLIKYDKIKKVQTRSDPRGLPEDIHDDSDSLYVTSDENEDSFEVIEKPPPKPYRAPKVSDQSIQQDNPFDDHYEA